MRCRDTVRVGSGDVSNPIMKWAIKVPPTDLENALSHAPSIDVRVASSTGVVRYDTVAAALNTSVSLVRLSWTTGNAAQLQLSSRTSRLRLTFTVLT